MSNESSHAAPAATASHAAPASAGRTPGKVYVLAHNRDSLRLWFQQQGLAAFRADQILQWVYRKGVADIEKMTDLSQDLRRSLKERLEIFRSQVLKQSRAADGVIKLLLELPPRGEAADAEALRRAPAGEGEPAEEGRSTGHGGKDRSEPAPGPSAPVHIECVMIPEADRRTACLSTQAGCPVGCVFCASGMGGLQRNLAAGEIVEQLLRLQAVLGPDKRMTHVVIMGMGEPLANFDATIEAIYAINEKWGFGLGARHITLSTVGIPQRIRELADHNLPINLALSLHAPTDALRRRLVPWAAHWTIKQIFDAARYYFDVTGREITLEYVLLAAINDHMTQAQQLATLARTLRCSVNLIPVNPVEGLEYTRPGAERVHAFQEVLRKAGVRCKVRRSRGGEADAACGQLRRRALMDG